MTNKTDFQLGDIDPYMDPHEMCALYEADIEAQVEALKKTKAARATGPRTPKGKAASSRNSLRHGLTAKNVLLPGEDPAEFDQLLADLTADRKPSGELELQLVAEIAGCMWRLSRARGFEAAHFNTRRQSFQGDAAKQLDLVLRYTGSIERQLNRTIVRLEQLQAARRKQLESKNLEPEQPFVSSNATASAPSAPSQVATPTRDILAFTNLANANQCQSPDSPARPVEKPSSTQPSSCSPRKAFAA